MSKMEDLIRQYTNKYRSADRYGLESVLSSYIWKLLIILVLILSGISSVQAQWTLNSTNLYPTQTNSNISIGQTTVSSMEGSSELFRLDVNGHAHVAGDLATDRLMVETRNRLHFPGDDLITTISTTIQMNNKDTQYSVIRAYSRDDDEYIGSLHFFNNMGNYTHLGNHANLNGDDYVSLGNWTNPGLALQNSTNRVGIGTVNPTEKLDVVGNAKATAFIGDGSQLTNLDASQLTTGTLSGEVMPANYTITVGDDHWGSLIFKTFNQDFNAGLRFFDEGASNANSRVQGTLNLYGNKGVSIGPWTTSNPTFYYDRAANAIGIRNGSPTEALDVVGNVKATAFIGDGSQLTGVSANIDNSIVLKGGSTHANYTGTQLSFGYNGNESYRHAIKTRHHGGMDTYNAIDFYVWDHGTDAAGDIGTKRVMTLDGAADGRVGIGITSPTQKLDVAGNVKATAFIGDGSQLTGVSTNIDDSIVLKGGSTHANYTGTQLSFGYNGNESYRHAIKTRHHGGMDTYNAIDFYVWDHGTDAAGDIGTKRVMTLDGAADGRVGIGVTSPTQKLDVAGNVKATSFIGDGNSLTNLNWDNISNIPSNFGGLWTANVSSISYSTGNVGIGTVDPTSSLHVYKEGAGTQTLLTLEKYEADINTNSEINLDFIFRDQNTNGTPQARISSIADTDVSNGGGMLAEGTADLKFWTASAVSNTSNDLAERMRITSQGQVGIGTTTPTEKLDVTGNVKATAFIGDGNSLTNLNWDNISNAPDLSSTGQWHTIENDNIRYGEGDVHIGSYHNQRNFNVFGGLFTNHHLSHRQYINIDANGPVSDRNYLLSQSSDFLFFMDPNFDDANDPVERMRITTSGEVGIGVTDPNAMLEVAGDIAMKSGGEFFTLDGTDRNWRIGSQSDAGFTRALATGRTHYLSTSGSETEGFAVGVNGGNSSFELHGFDHTAYFRGNVGIGNTAPAEKLDVAGNVKATAFIGDGSQLTNIQVSNDVPHGSGTTNTVDRVINWHDATGGTEIHNDEIYLTAGNNSDNTSQPESIGMALFNNSTAADVYSPAITFGGKSPSNEFMNGAAAIAARLSAGFNAHFRSGDLIFYTQDDSDRGLTEKMRIDPHGNVGIGTTAPSEKLAVEGNIKATSFRFGDYGKGFTMTEPTWIRTLGGANIYAGSGIIRTDGKFQIGFNGEKFLADENGRVGILNANPVYELDVAGTVNATDIRIDGESIGGSLWKTAGTTGVGYGGQVVVADTLRSKGLKVYSDLSFASPLVVASPSDLLLETDAAGDVNVTNSLNIGGNLNSHHITARDPLHSTLRYRNYKGVAGQNIHMDAHDGQNIYLNYYSGKDVVLGHPNKTNSLKVNGEVEVVGGALNLDSPTPLVTLTNDNDVEANIFVTGSGHGPAQDRLFINGPTTVLGSDANTNVGIGTSNPAYKLDVAGDVNISGDLTVNGHSVGEIGLYTDAINGATVYSQEFAGASGRALSYTNDFNINPQDLLVESTLLIKGQPGVAYLDGGSTAGSGIIDPTTGLEIMSNALVLGANNRTVQVGNGNTAMMNINVEGGTMALKAKNGLNISAGNSSDADEEELTITADHFTVIDPDDPADTVFSSRNLWGVTGVNRWNDVPGQSRPTTSYNGNVRILGTNYSQTGNHIEIGGDVNYIKEFYISPTNGSNLTIGSLDSNSGDIGLSGKSVDVLSDTLLTTAKSVLLDTVRIADPLFWDVGLLMSSKWRSIGQSKAVIETNSITTDLYLGVGKIHPFKIGHDRMISIARKENNTFHHDPYPQITRTQFAMVVGNGILTEDLAIADHTHWADYVFEEDYELSSLEEMEAYLKEHKHLPGIISKSDIEEQGFYHVPEVIVGQLKNLEEQVLHNIAQEKKINEQAAQLKAQAEQLERLQQLVEQLLNDQ